MLNISLGDFELTHVTDGTFMLDGGTMFGIVPKSIWQRRCPADEHNLIRFGLNSLVVRTGDKTVLIETGAGPKLPGHMRSLYQTQPALLGNLGQLGISPEDIDVVINTHLHFDHCGWNTLRRDGRIVATFPRATYYVQRGEVEHARLQSPRDAVSYRGENYDPLIASGQMELLDGDRELLPGISVRRYPGHTRDLQAVLIRSRKQTACFVSDLIPSRFHLKPTWALAYDLDPLQTFTSRRRFYQEAIPERWLIIFAHDPTVPWAYVNQDEKGRYSFEPVGLALERLAS